LFYFIGKICVGQKQDADCPLSEPRAEFLFTDRKLVKIVALFPEKGNLAVHPGGGVGRHY